ncbi:MAG: tRNA (adenosine(37)-N6)-dimethylallyltransferase MiaA [Clostridiales bacterium]|nr:tRNA (adenosine(37)-N6)-dimethylallyltransferase MiaA [Clostridiales bacterium]
MDRSFPVFEKYKYIPIIAGPTASGKSALAMEICRNADGELVCADSMQIYRGLDIGTAKDSEDELAGIPHYMTDIIDPGTDFSVFDYVSTVLPIIKDILVRGKLPVVCGGTGQYVSALLYGLDYGAGDDEAELFVTKELEEELSREGIDVLYSRLVQTDPEAARLIHPNNTRRVIRALAVQKALGITFTEKNRRSKVKGPEYPFKVFMIDWNREELYDRINKRVGIMIENGIIDEAKMLKDSGVDRSSTCWQAIGYKEMLKYLNGEETLEQAADRIRTGTRHYAKRQLTWFRGMGEDVTYLRPDDPAVNAKRVIDLCTFPKQIRPSERSDGP